MKTAVVLGGGGFIGHHLVKRLKLKGYEITVVDLKQNPYEQSSADHFIQADLRDSCFVKEFFKTPFDEIYQLAADMGGAAYVLSGDKDADIMHNSVQINLNVLEALKTYIQSKIFYSSSACIYPEANQTDEEHPVCAEDTAYPASPDSEYGWEKLFSERLYHNYAKNYGLNIRIARFHNIFGTLCDFDGGREKAPAALCRKVILAEDGNHIEVWGDGLQTRSFLWIDECLEGIERLMQSEYRQALNIGSDKMIPINDLAGMLIGFSKKNIRIKNIPGPVGVRGRCSDNNKIQQILNWQPEQNLESGMRQLYNWIASQIQ